MKVPFNDLTRIHAPLAEEFSVFFNSILKSSEFILGSKEEEFEQEYAKFEGAKYGVGIANGTDGITLALKACGITKGDEVITQSHTFIASALGISYAEATPVLADIDEKTYTLDPNSAAKMITKKTKAILPVCLYGQPANIGELQKLAKDNNLKLILDNAQAHGATYKSNPLGKYGDAGSYSFYPGKNLGALGDGGFVTSNSKLTETQVRLLRNIGRNGWYKHPVKGYNSRLDTLQAGFLSIKLKHLKSWTLSRRKAAKIYDELLKDCPIILPQENPDRTHVYHLYVIRTKKRKEFMNFLGKHGIQTLIHYPIPIHKQLAYSELPKKSLPISEKVAREVVSLPLFVGITEAEQTYVADTIKKFFK